MSQGRKYIADSAVFIMGGLDILPSEMISVPAVEDEMVSEAARLRYALAKEGGLRIEAADPSLIGRVKDRAAVTKDIDVLSETDLAVLAKAFEHKDSTVLLTDDFAVQNVAAGMGVSVRPIAQRTIKDKIVWQKRCTGCGRHFAGGEECPVCGSPMRRKMKRKKEIGAMNQENVSETDVESLFRKKRD